MLRARQPLMRTATRVIMTVITRVAEEYSARPAHALRHTLFGEDVSVAAIAEVQGLPRERA